MHINKFLFYLLNRNFVSTTNIYKCPYLQKYLFFGICPADN